jgi:flagellar operon protein
MSAITNPALIPPGVGVAPSTRPATTPARQAGAGAAAGGNGSSEAARPFSDVLAGIETPGSESSTAGSLRFSKHALQRVQKRGIELDPSTLSRLNEGVGRAAGKGSRDSVVLVDGTAFVVSVANRTVLTAVAPEHMREQVFTNIDSAVIA